MDKKREEKHSSRKRSTSRLYVSSATDGVETIQSTAVYVPVSSVWKKDENFTACLSISLTAWRFLKAAINLYISKYQ